MRTGAALRVLYLQPATDFGGAERQATYSIAGLPRYGVEVVAAVGPGPLIVEELERLGVRGIHRAGFPSDEQAPRSGLARAALIAHYVRSFFRMTEELTGLLRRRPCDLIFASRPFSWVVGGRVGAALGVPVIWRAGTLFNHPLQPPWLRLAARLWPPRAIVCTSRAVERALAKHVTVAPSHVVYNGVDTARFSPTIDRGAARAALGLDERAPVVALAARLSPEKGTELLLEICRALQVQVPRVQVLVAGDTRWRARFDGACRAAGLDGTVRRLAFVPEVERVYAAADVVLLTSRTEGCPNALLEAMAMGRPVVATAVDGTIELVRDGVDGLLVPQSDPEGFAERVAELLVSAPRAGALGRAALATVRRRFTLDAQLARLAQILHHAAGRRPTVEQLAS
ncbi:MAG TPA: glycosyltransferase family 4 protein [Polyangia bacterium]|nr:glycosyltransferase family 4 protein [Polyangia bacterium]